MSTSAEPLDVHRDRLDYARWCAVEKSREFGATFTDADGQTRSYAAWAPAALPSQELLELGFKGHSEHEAIRLRFADKVECEVLPLWSAKYVHNVIDRLRGARQSGWLGFNLKTERYVRFWDQKAGLARYCPDDAREEAMRVNRKYLPRLVELQAEGHALHYCVLTAPNAAAGDLLKSMKWLFRRFRQLLKAKYPDGSMRFPEIKGALVVQEAPLGRSRDWHVHLNVIFVVKADYFDWEKLRKWWHWNLHIQKLPKGEDAIRSALTELIKYAVAATVSKSAKKADLYERRDERAAPDPTDHREAPGDPVQHRLLLASSGSEARDGDHSAVAEHRSDVGAGVVGGDGAAGWRESSGGAPPMLEWTAAELIEWMKAQRGFRRTRSYGVLFGLKKPEREEIGPIVWLSTFSSRGGGRGYHVHSDPFRFIPEDKSSGLSAAERWLGLKKALGLAGIAGARTLGESIPRDALHSSIKQLQKM